MDVESQCEWEGDKNGNGADRSGFETWLVWILN